MQAKTERLRAFSFLPFYSRGASCPGPPRLTDPLQAAWAAGTARRSVPHGPHRKKQAKPGTGAAHITSIALLSITGGMKVSLHTHWPGAISVDLGDRLVEQVFVIILSFDKFYHIPARAAPPGAILCPGINRLRRRRGGPNRSSAPAVPQ